MLMMTSYASNNKIHSKSVIKDIIIVFLIFLFIYYPPLFGINVMHILAVVSYLYLLSHGTALLSFKQNFSKYGYFIFVFLYLFIVCLLNDQLSNLSGVFVWLFEVIPITFMIIDIIHSNNMYAKKVSVWNYLIAAGMLQAAVSILAFAIPALQDLIIQRMLTYGFKDVIIKMSGHRMFGFSYTMAFAMPVVQSILAAVCIYKAFAEKLRYLVLVPFLLFSSIVNARIGIVVFVIAGIIALVGSAKITPNNLLVLLLAIVMIFAVPKIFAHFLEGSKTFDWLQEGINEITGFLFEQDTSDGYFSYATNEQKYKVPDGIGFFFGTGNISTRGNANYASDIGFINDMWLGGIFYVIPLLAYFLGRTNKIMKFYFDGKSVCKLVSLITIGMLLIINIKGRCFSWNEIMNLWFLVNTFVITKYFYDEEKERSYDFGESDSCCGTLQQC